jgi:hypothetical protein
LRNSSNNSPDGHWPSNRVSASTTTAELAPDASIVAETAGTKGWLALEAAWIALTNLICSDWAVSAAPATPDKPSIISPATPTISFLIILFFLTRPHTSPTQSFLTMS